MISLPVTRRPAALAILLSVSNLANCFGDLAIDCIQANPILIGNPAPQLGQPGLDPQPPVIVLDVTDVRQRILVAVPGHQRPYPL